MCLAAALICLNVCVDGPDVCRRGSRVAPAPLDSASKVQAAVQARQHKEAQMAIERRAVTGSTASPSGKSVCEYCRHICISTPETSMLSLHKREVAACRLQVGKSMPGYILTSLRWQAHTAILFMA